VAGSLATRVRRLEEAAPDDGGCDRCCGTLIIVGDAPSGEFVSASWNGEPLSGEEVRERQTERKCRRCGRKLDPEEDPVIEVGGRRR
jgi:hypothetical protein